MNSSILNQSVQFNTLDLPQALLVHFHKNDNFEVLNSEDMDQLDDLEKREDNNLGLFRIREEQSQKEVSSIVTYK